MPDTSASRLGIRRALTARVDDLIQHRFLSPMTAALRRLSSARARDFLERWLASEYYVSRDFPRWLAGLMFQLPQPEHRHLLAENIWDEHGHGDFERSHYAQCRAMLSSLDVPVPDGPPAPAAAYIHGVDQMIRRGRLDALAVIGPANEFLIPREYGCIWRHFNDAGWTSSAMARFFEANISADEEHIEQLERIVRAELRDERCEHAFLRAAEEGLALRLRFYTQLLESLESPRRRDASAPLA